MGRKVAESCHILSSHYTSAVSMFSFPKRENTPEKRYPFHCTDKEPTVREEKQFSNGPVVRAGNKISSGRQ